MSTPISIIVIAFALALIIGVSAGLVIGRRRRAHLLEPPSDAPRVPPHVLEELAEQKEAEADVEVDPALATAVEEAVAPVEAEAVIAEAEAIVADAAPEAPTRPRFRDRLTKARGLLSDYLSAITGRGAIDNETWDELEEALIRADVGVAATTALLDRLRNRVADDKLTDGDQLLTALKDDLKAQLSGFDLDLNMVAEGPSIWLFVGVNGVGKTTTIGKLAKREVAAGHKVVLAAGDTFRAAAAEQLGMWAERSGSEFVRGDEGSDPSAVIFDAVESASARGADLVLADTAGRLHTKTNLMEELRKVRRVADKGAGTVCEVLLVIDATTGQNGLVQAQQFTEAVEVTGVVLTKLDGSAKGGIVVAIQSELGIPVKLVGLGEGADDLVPFDSDEFVEALFS